MMQFGNGCHITHRHLRHLFKHIEIRKIRNPRITDNRNIDDSILFLSESFRQRILILKSHLHIRHHSGDRYAAALLEHCDSRIKNCLIATELIDDKPLHTRLFLLGKKHQRSEKLREHAAPIDVSDQKHRRIDHLGHAHIDDIIFL